MRAFDVYLNGKRLCIAGIGEDGVLNAMVNCIVKNGADHMSMNVGGLKSSTEEHIRWNADRLMLGVGDEVLVKIIEAESVDKPQRIYRFDTQKAAKRQSTKLGR